MKTEKGSVDKELTYHIMGSRVSLFKALAGGQMKSFTMKYSQIDGIRAKMINLGVASEGGAVLIDPDATKDETKDEAISRLTKDNTGLINAISQMKKDAQSFEEQTNMIIRQRDQFLKTNQGLVAEMDKMEESAGVEKEERKSKAIAEEIAPVVEEVEKMTPPDNSSVVEMSDDDIYDEGKTTEGTNEVETPAEPKELPEEMKNIEQKADPSVARVDKEHSWMQLNKDLMKAARESGKLDVDFNGLPPEERTAKIETFITAMEAIYDSYLTANNALNPKEIATKDDMDLIADFIGFADLNRNYQYVRTRHGRDKEDFRLDTQISEGYFMRDSYVADLEKYLTDALMVNKALDAQVEA